MSDLSMPFIRLTENAKKHFADLLLKEAMAEMGIRISVNFPGTPMAELAFCFCLPKESKADDICLFVNNFALYIDKAVEPYLVGTIIDYKIDEYGGQLAITAPNLRGFKPKEDAPLAEKVSYYINNDINPQLANHGGRVSLVTINKKNEVFLRFGGGCQGCGMVDMTLKHGIENTLMEKLPQITAVKDITDHHIGNNPYC